MSQESQSEQGSRNTFAWSPNTSDDSIKYRLNPDPIFKKIQVRLLGLMTEEYETKDGEIQTRIKQVGRPKVNEVGFQAVMMQLEMVINPMTVQGNLSDEQYHTFIADFHEALYDDLWRNSTEYGIQEDDFNGIVLSCVNFARLFITRPIADKERLALGQSQQVRETVTQQQQQPRTWKRWVPGL